MINLDLFLVVSCKVDSLCYNQSEFMHVVKMNQNFYEYE